MLNSRSLVFSHWGKTLDLLETALQEHNIRFLRLDGSMTLEQRGTVMLQFKISLDIKVLLLTYASGSVGYVKSRCYNPSHLIVDLTEISLAKL